MAATARHALDPLPVQEIYGPTVTVSDPKYTSPIISYGLTFDKAIINHVPSDARVYIIASKTLSQKTSHLDSLKNALGSRVVGVRIGMASHTIYQECLEVVLETKAVSADTIVTLGGGSIADGAKFVCNALTNDYHDVKDLEEAEAAAASKAQIGKGEPNSGLVPHRKLPANRLILIPTSLSGGEHTPYSGITDRDTKRKYQIFSKQADVTILDPWLAMDTPLNIWLQSGVRGIDHCVESMLSIYVHSEGVETASQGLQLLIPGLFRGKRDSENKDVIARLNAQIGVSLAILNVCWQIPLGASHGIGHMLGPMGIGHGETSCILLPAVCKYNAEVDEHAERQNKVRKVLWNIPECKELFDREGVTEDADLGDLLDKVIRELGMPRSLSEKGITGQRVRDLAEMSVKDFWCQTNPRPLNNADEIMEILERVR